MNVMRLNKLSPTVKLPYQVVRGTVAQRQNMSIQYVEKLYQDLLPKFNNGTITIEDLQKSVKSVLDNRGGVKVKKVFNPEYDGVSDVIFSPYSGRIVKTTMEISTKNSNLDFPSLVTILHEFQHITDQLFHPKYLALNQLMANRKMYNSKYNNLYDNYLCCREDLPLNKDEKRKILNIIKYRVLRFLKGHNVQDKVMYLKDLIYGLVLEDQAYRTQLKYAKKLNKKHITLNCYDLNDENVLYMFQDKINLLKNLAFDIIKVSREKHAKK